MPLRACLQIKCTGVVGMVRWCVQPPEWLEYANAEHWGYCRVWANASQLRLDWVMLVDGEVGDRVYLEKLP